MNSTILYKKRLHDVVDSLFATLHPKEYDLVVRIETANLQ